MSRVECQGQEARATVRATKPVSIRGYGNVVGPTLGKEEGTRESKRNFRGLRIRYNI